MHLEEWGLTAADFTPPAKIHERAPPTWHRPAHKASPPVKVANNVLAARTDEELRTIISKAPSDKTVAVQFSSTWCAHCHQMFPHFFQLSNKYPDQLYVVAQLDFMEKEVKDIRYTPTFAFYKHGRKVDQFWGSDPQQLRDHAWLHAAD